MSSGFGHSKTYGDNYGSNTSWQRRVLQLLGLIEASTGSSEGYTAHSGFTATFSTTAAGSVAAGSAYSVVFHNTGGSSGTVNGAPLAANSSRTYTAAYKKTLPSITYNATGTIFYIEQLNY
jgi:hypothetical protein